MSRMRVRPITPEQFHDSEGVDDWRVMYGGAHAFFRTESFLAGAHFAVAVAEAAAAIGRVPDVDLRAEGVAVQFCTFERLGQLTTLDVEASRRISAVAREHGLVADPSQLQVIQLAVASVPDAEVMPFWRAALGFDMITDEDLVDPLRRNSAIWFQDDMPPEKPRRGRMHVDVCVPHDQVRARIEAALAAGGRLADDSYAPRWWTLADPENHGVDITTWWGRDVV